MLPQRLHVSILQDIILIYVHVTDLRFMIRGMHNDGRFLHEGELQSGWYRPALPSKDLPQAFPHRRFH